MTANTFLHLVLLFTSILINNIFTTPVPNDGSHGSKTMPTGDLSVVCNTSCVNGYCIGNNLCQCYEGWTGTLCDKDINECIISTNICHHNCNNTEGSYTCYCNEGYQLMDDDITCDDINECETDDHGCTHYCTNTNGSYVCSCRTGYNYTGNGQCEDIDECFHGNSGCQQLCINTNGSYYCECESGYRLMKDNSSCVEEPDPCTLPLRPGPCSNKIRRYFFNATSRLCQEFLYGGCLSNDNNFNTLHSCEEKCSDCYPECTPEYCTTNRGGTCSMPSSRPGSTSGCPGGCAISNCRACYHSYNDLPFPLIPVSASCPRVCSMTNSGVDEKCMEKWGRCVQQTYYSLHQRLKAHERNHSNFRCWSHQCEIDSTS